MLTRLFFAGCIAAVFAAPPTASASSICAERDSMITKLKDKYGEAERGMGLSGTEAVIEIWSSEKTGTWTIVMTKPNGVSCVMAAGDSWMDIPVEKGPET
jgi:hypothetical protein